jgi:hypothetical protein
VEVATLSALDGGQLLNALRDVLRGADEAFLCSAFVADAGVHLIKAQLRDLGGNARLLTTTVFGSTKTSALNAAAELGVQVRTLNLPTGSYHAKLYVGARWRLRSALIGSCNLTGGLVTNAETGVVLRGDRGDPPIHEAWRIAEDLWDHPSARPWEGTTGAAPDPFSPGLLALLRAAAMTDPTFHTLGPTPRRNIVTEVAPHGVYVETARSRLKRTPPQLIPAWMLELAYSYLLQHGRLSNRYLLDTEGLNVKRSSAVCAMLARLPGVRVLPGRDIVLVTSAPRAEETASIAADRDGGPVL